MIENLEENNRVGDNIFDEANMEKKISIAEPQLFKNVS